MCIKCGCGKKKGQKGYGMGPKKSAYKMGEKMESKSMKMKETKMGMKKMGKKK
jgi:hypothetical protein